MRSAFSRSELRQEKRGDEEGMIRQLDDPSQAVLIFADQL
jgi:hypothetical protein